MDLALQSNPFVRVAFAELKENFASELVLELLLKFFVTRNLRST